MMSIAKVRCRILGVLITGRTDLVWVVKRFCDGRDVTVLLLIGRHENGGGVGSG